MSNNIGLKLKGEFKFDLYDSGDNLIHSSDFTDNFITNSGVIYPYYFAFADCFRYLSVGTGTTGNSIINNGGANPETTGLQYPLSEYAYIGGRQNFYQPASTNYGTGCGFQETLSGINLFRQWTLPDNQGGLFSSSQIFNEFMVSPGQPYVTYQGNNLCTCDETLQTSFAPYTIQGNDNSAVAMYYNWVQSVYNTIGQYRPTMCDAIYAFARIVYSVNVVENSYLNITYRLSVNPFTGLSASTLAPQQPGQLDPNWDGTLKSISAITQPGICLINDGTINNAPVAPNGGIRIQKYPYLGTNNGNFGYTFANEYGESFVPPMGAPLEPSNLSVGGITPSVQNIVYYLSTDNTEFLVTSTGGNFNQTGNCAPWNPNSGVVKINNSGLAPFLNNNSVIIDAGVSYWENNPNTFDIRESNNQFPSPTDITQTLSASVNIYTCQQGGYTNPVPAFSDLLIPGTNAYRTGQMTYTFGFPSYEGGLIYIKSLVAGYIDYTSGESLNGGDDVNPVPFFDCLFSTGNGAFFLPSIVTGRQTYEGGNWTDGTITGAYLSGTDSNNYYSLVNGPSNHYPIFNTVLTWSVPCPQGVSGCN